MALDTDIFSYSSTITSGTGKKLFAKYWEPADKAKALVFIAHGYSEHCLLYDSLAKLLASKNFYVFSHDHVGHGQSEGSRVQIDSFDRFLDDVFMHVDLVKKKQPGIDCFICGHSMGGAISILSALRKPQYFKGVVLIGPAVMHNPELASPFKVGMARLLRRFAPWIPVGKLDLSLACSCPKEVKRMEEDPFRYHGSCKAGLGASLMDAMMEIQEKLASVSFPFLLCQGEEDKICIPEGALLFHEKSTSTDKTIKMYPGAYHCLLYEPNGISDQVKSDILEWLLARVKASS